MGRRHLDHGADCNLGDGALNVLDGHKMSVSVPSDCIEPRNPEAVICRFLTFKKFEDVAKTGELYFNRADLFPQDRDEGIPEAEYQRLVLGLNPLDLHDRLKMNHDEASTAQFRESFYVSCWYLFDEEKDKTWKLYGEDGVAVFSRYSRLKAAIDGHQKAFLAQVRYGIKHLTGWNILRFIMTKREEYRDDREIRALLWHPELIQNTARHFDLNNFPHSRPLTQAPYPTNMRWKVDLSSLITRIVVSPYAVSGTLTRVQALATAAGLSVPIEESELTRFRNFLL